MRRIKVLILVQLLIFLPFLHFSLFAKKRSVGEDRPNVIFFLADDIGFNDVPWNNKKVKAPNLETLASESVIMNDYYTYSSCSPSRASLMTGYYQNRHHLPGLSTLSPTGLNTDLAIMPQYFKALGYTTHMVGKWHLGYCNKDFLPTRRGFDSFYGFYNGASSYSSHEAPINMGRHNYNYIYDFVDNEQVDLEANGTHSGRLFLTRSLRLLRAHINSGSPDPFFLMLSFQAIHEPLQLARYRTGREGVEDFPDIPNSKRVKALKMIYDLDATIGEIRDVLERRKLMDNTVVVFTSDNGATPCQGGNNYPLRGGRRTQWEGGVRVPALIRLPRALRDFAGQFSGLFHVTDWLPTLFSAVGGRSNFLGSLDGVDQLKALRTNRDHPRDEIFSIHGRHGAGMLRSGDYKILRGRHCAGVWVTEEDMLSEEYKCPFNEAMNCKGSDDDDEDGNSEGEDLSSVQIYNVRTDPGERVDLSSNASLADAMLRRYKQVLLTYDQVTRQDRSRVFSMVKTGTVQTNWC